MTRLSSDEYMKIQKCSPEEIMNILQDISIHFVHATYHVYNEMELIVVEITYKDGHTSQFAIYEAPIFDSFYRFFDMDEKKNGISKQLLSFNLAIRECIEDWQGDLMNKEISMLIHRITTVYIEYSILHPIFLMYTRYIFEIIVMVRHNKNVDRIWVPSNVYHLDRFNDDTHEAVQNQINFTEYLQNVFLLPHDNGINQPAAYSIISYELFLSTKKEKSHLADLIARNVSDNPQYLESDMNNWNDAMFLFSRDLSFLASGKREIRSSSIWDSDVPNDTTFSFFIEFIMKYMLETSSTIKVCPNCKRLFISRSSSNTVYCNRIYKNTKETCQSYASHANYRKRKFKNPIHAEYRKVYNRLYARISRGTMKDNPILFQKLLEVRDEYVHLYEEVQASPSSQLRILNDFKDKVSKLVN